MSSGSRLRAVFARIQQFERRELAELRRWLEDTQNFVHVSVLLFAPLLIGAVTFLSNSIKVLPFLLFPPLASGAHMLFTNPESQIASVRRFVGGMTIGAVCGWLALTVTAQYYQTSPETFAVNPGAAAFGVFLTGVVTWLLDCEESQAFSTALLVLVVGVTQFVYVVSVFASSLLVAGVFAVWRRNVYEQRANYLYQTVHGDDEVLVPMRGDTAERVALLGARLAAAHDAGKVVLLDVVSEEQQTGETAQRLEAHAAEITDRFDVPCEVCVAAGDPADAHVVTQTANEMGCDLIVTPYEATDGGLSQFVRRLFTTSFDVVVVRTDSDSSDWRRILVPVRRSGDVAHAMVDFAGRLAGETGHVAVCHCIEDEQRRREAEEMLSTLVEPFGRAVETRVANASIASFLDANAHNYDLTIVGSSTDRSAVSRFIDPPTFRGLDNIDCDVAIVHRG